MLNKTPEPAHQAAHGTAASLASGGRPLEFLAFTLGEEEYGIDIQKVQELRGYDAVTRIANAPEFIKGVVNLRGIIVPIIDMRIKFALGKPSYDQFTVVIVLNIGGRVVGMVVDSVSDVITLSAEQINQAITQMDQVTQQNAALVEEAAAAAQSMQEQAGNLVEAVSVFKLQDRTSHLFFEHEPQDRRTTADN